jgi:predicted nucleic acid-binding protein
MQFVDTNVLLYAYFEAGDKHEVAGELVDRLWREGRGALSIQVLQEFYVNATRKVAKTTDPEIAGDLLKSLVRWRVHSPLPNDVIAAASWSRRHRISFWDAMIVRSAAELHCDTLWTEDLNDGQLVEGVRLRNPFTDTAPPP